MLPKPWPEAYGRTLGVVDVLGDALLVRVRLRVRVSVRLRVRVRVRVRVRSMSLAMLAFITKKEG